MLYNIAWQNNYPKSYLTNFKIKTLNLTAKRFYLHLIVSINHYIALFTVIAFVSYDNIICTLLHVTE